MRQFLGLIILIVTILVSMVGAYNIFLEINSGLPIDPNKMVILFNLAHYYAVVNLIYRYINWKFGPVEDPLMLYLGSALLGAAFIIEALVLTSVFIPLNFLPLTHFSFMVVILIVNGIVVTYSLFKE